MNSSTMQGQQIVETLPAIAVEQAIKKFGETIALAGVSLHCVAENS